MDIYSIVVEVPELEIDDVDMVLCCGHKFCDATHIAGERCTSLGLRSYSQLRVLDAKVYIMGDC